MLGFSPLASSPLASGGEATRILSLAAVETGSDAFSSSITVQTPSPVTISAQETGSDTALVLSTVTASVQVNSTETGTDTASATSKVSISLQTSATEAGSDTSTSQVRISVVTYASAVETSADSCKINIPNILASTNARPTTGSINVLSIPATSNSYGVPFIRTSNSL